MKRVLVLNYEFPPLGGGASPVSYEIAERLSKFSPPYEGRDVSVPPLTKGRLGGVSVPLLPEEGLGAVGEFDIDVVTMGYKGLPKYEEVNKNFRIHRVKCLRSKKEICHPWEQLTYLFFGYFKCCELFKKSKFDICHCHFIIPTGVLAQKLKKKFGLEYIITSHGSDIPGYNEDRFVLLHKFTGPLLKSIVNDAKFACTGSNYLSNLANKNIKANKQYQVIREGFDSNKFTPQEKKKIILSTGRLLERKGFQYLIKAVSDEDLGHEVHICGDGPMMNELEDLANSSKTKIVFHGWIDNGGIEYKNLLEQAAVYVLMSAKENSSVSLLEAMGAGCAVITTNVSGCPETVAEAGLLVTPKDTAGLKIQINSLVNNQDQLSRLQQMAVERVKNVYSWDNVLKDYIQNL